MTPEEEEIFRDRIATVDENGKRIWVYPKKPAGWYYDKRKLVSYVLLIVLFVIPFIKVEGEPFMMFNVTKAKFILFGQIFWPQDLYIFALALIIGVVFVIFFTIIFGRLFCGWICPQTLFMEFVFRQVEYWIDGDFTHQRKLDKAPWTNEKIFKRILKHTIFLIISFAVANVFLAYIISADELWKIISEPISQHIVGFIALVAFTIAFYFVFARLREQVCTTICPYGRLQGVLLDENSMVIAYDYVRGEKEAGRAKFRKNEDREELGKGDCIDCNQCVLVCPTGIDIRHGTQLECVNCTACIDACDHMMESVGLPKGLIRYESEKGIKEGIPFRFTTRIKAYSIVLVVLLTTMFTLLITRQDFNTRIMRQRGTTFQTTEDGQVSNIFEIYILNKTRKTYDITLKLEGDHGTVETATKNLKLLPEKELKERLIIKIPFKQVKDKEVLYVDVYGNGEKIQRVKIKFIGPIY